MDADADADADTILKQRRAEDVLWEGAGKEQEARKACFAGLLCLALVDETPNP